MLGSPRYRCSDFKQAKRAGHVPQSVNRNCLAGHRGKPSREMPLSALGASVSVQTSGGETCAVQRIEGWLQKLIFNVDEQVIICLGNQLERNTCVIEDMFDAK
jgi:hypothetical protein